MLRSNGFLQRCFIIYSRETQQKKIEREREREICRFIGIELRLTDRQIKFQLDRKQSDMREVDR